jgi:triosephosphate isomerase
MKSKRKIIVANWKMNPISFDEAKKLWSKSIKKIEETERISVIISPPYPYLTGLKKPNSKKIYLGSQDCSFERSGAYTGLVSPTMLFDIGVSYVIVGHSEVRKRGDTDEIVNKKMHSVIDSGMNVIVCIGEEKRNDNGEHLLFLKEQIEKTFKGINKNNYKNIIIAYEPVWAIGASSAMDSHSIYETSLFIRKIITEKFKIPLRSIPVLYGGSVDQDNCKNIVKDGDVDGLLVGRQSLDIKSFTDIVSALDF